MPLVEIAGLRRVAIALLGDGEGDDANGGIGHSLDQSCRALACDHAVEQRTDDAVLGAFGRTDGNRIEMILRGEGVACVRAAQARADDAPRWGAGCKTIVDDDGLVGAMKRAKAEMHDAGGDARTVVGRAADAGWQLIEIGAAKARRTRAHGRLPLLCRCLTWRLSSVNAAVNW